MSASSATVPFPRNYKNTVGRARASSKSHFTAGNSRFLSPRTLAVRFFNRRTTFRLIVERRRSRALWDDGAADCKRLTEVEARQVGGRDRGGRSFSEVIKLARLDARPSVGPGSLLRSRRGGLNSPGSVQRQTRGNRTKAAAAIRSPRSGVGSALLAPRTGMLLVTWAVGTPITRSSSSLTIRGPDRIGHQARSWHRDGRRAVTARVDLLGRAERSNPC